MTSGCTKRPSDLAPREGINDTGLVISHACSASHITQVEPTLIVATNKQHVPSVGGRSPVSHGRNGRNGTNIPVPLHGKSTRCANRKNGRVGPVPPVHLTTPIPCQIIPFFLMRWKPRSESRMPQAFCRSGCSPFSSPRVR